MGAVMNERAMLEARLWARLHDPIEKPLVLLRDPRGHEGGTVAALRDRLFPGGVPSDVDRAVKRADWWASAGDRPQFPRSERDPAYARWTQVDFSKRPVLIHPLSGAEADLESLATLDPILVQQTAEHHLARLIKQIDDMTHSDDEARLRRLALALWRFGPEVTEKEIGDGTQLASLGQLWRLLPADTRIPDHSIWEHLDLVAAFAAAFASDPDSACSLVAVSLGPVQSFIAEARSTSDLWAGSHLLSQLSWEAMRVICEQFGPESILFPSLRGVAQVDHWLEHREGLPEEWFVNLEHRSRATDQNPLFSATLPNRFTALLPSGSVEAVMAKVRNAVRTWVLERALAAWDEVLELAECDPEGRAVGRAQIEAQVAGFPQVHWAEAQWSTLTPVRDPQRPTDVDVAPLRAALAFHGAQGFVDSEAWSLLTRQAVDEGKDLQFFRPNPGALFPDIMELVERTLAADKSVRPFHPVAAAGYRCSLTAVDEWICTDRAQLTLPPGARTDTVWGRLAEPQRGLVRPGEHLGALGMLKRMWPRMFVQSLRKTLGLNLQRFVVSTHTMAMTDAISKWLDRVEASPEVAAELDRIDVSGLDAVAMPPGLAGRARDILDDAKRLRTLARIPAWLESMDTEEGPKDAHGTFARAFGQPPDRYYALLMMDGDRMGAWFAGAPEFTQTHLKSFHPQVREVLMQRAADNPALASYLEHQRGASPARQAAISSALNDFATSVCRQVVEHEFDGRVLYAGGDDVLAMLPAAQLPGVIRALRLAWSGCSDDDAGNGLEIGRGYARGRDGRLMRMMGERASASFGAVIVHHRSPIRQALARLRRAEAAAKAAGRDGWHLEIHRRSGGITSCSGRFAKPGDPDDTLMLIQALREVLAGHEDASRRAVYSALEWFRTLPEPELLGAGRAGEEALRALALDLLLHEFQRHGLGDAGQTLARRILDACPCNSAAIASTWLESLLSTAEFLAREVRSA